MTLLQVRKKLEDWFNNHAQVNQVTTLRRLNFAAERNLVYPCVNIQFVSSAPNNKMLGYIFEITLADLADPNYPDISDHVLNDFTLIQEDLYAYLSNVQGMNLSYQGSINPFYDDIGDRTAGITFSITLQVFRDANECAIPTKN